MHEAGEPEPVVDLFDADALAGEDLAEIDLAALEANAPACGDDDLPVMEGIVYLRQAGIGAG